MGMIQVQYKQSRGVNEPGTPVTDPKDWFEIFIQDCFDSFKPQYDALPDDKKNTFKSFFDESDVMANKSSFSMWLNESMDDTDYLAETKS